MKTLVDTYGRQIRKLRVSLTDRCNLRCHYCMPVDQTFMDESRYLQADDYAEIVGELVDRGLEEVRLTGGEPLVRRSFPEILNAIARHPLRKLGLTTNGILLDRHLDLLKEKNALHLNVSLDSLVPERFAAITRGNHLPRVLANLLRARDLGFHVKVNMVVLRGINDDEIERFVDWSREEGIEVRYLELMRIGHANDAQSRQFVSAGEILARLQKRFVLIPETTAADSTSFNFRTPDGARIGFIASESQAFCGTCSRWRLSADGILRACLLREEGLSVVGAKGAAREEIFRNVLGMKPGVRPAEVAHAMNRIGG